MSKIKINVKTDKQTIEEECDGIYMVCINVNHQTQSVESSFHTNIPYEKILPIILDHAKDKMEAEMADITQSDIIN